jgi:predicted dehydrogenase
LIQVKDRDSGDAQYPSHCRRREYAMLNAAIVGLGWWGETIARLLVDNRKIRVVQAVTRSAAGRATARRHGLAIAPDYDDALRDPGIAAVILCTPNTLHVGQVLRAAAAGKHVFCEKPLALTRREAEAAVTACEANRVTLGVGHERRFEPAILEMRRAVLAGELGTLLQIEANFSQDKFLDLPADNWRLSATEAPAGPMTATGIHLLDLAVSFLGPADRVLANARRLGSDLANGDSLALLVEFKSGASALLGALLATPFAGRFAVYGNQGWAEAVDKAHPDAPQGATLTISRRGGSPFVVEYPAVSAVRANLEAFADASAGRARYPVSPSEMIATIAALEACLKSAASGAVERVAG